MESILTGSIFLGEHFFGSIFGEHFTGSIWRGSTDHIQVIILVTFTKKMLIQQLYSRQGILKQAQNFSAQKWVCSNLSGSKMGLLKFCWLKNGPAQIWVGSNLGLLKFGSAQIWVCSNLVRSNLAAQIWAAQKWLDTYFILYIYDSLHYTLDNKSFPPSF